MAETTPQGSSEPRAGGDAGKRRWRDIVVPKTALGAMAALLTASIGAAFSGAVLFAFYQSQLQEVEDKVERFTGAAEETGSEIIDEIQTAADDARAQIRAELEPLQELRASEETLQDLAEQVAESVWFLGTRDDDGQPLVGSAFVVAADAEQSFFLTSLQVVRASTASPGPGITLRQGEDEVDATLWTWDEGRDLALLIVPRPNLPRLEWAPTDPPLGLGQRVFAVQGLGGAGAGITQGFIADVSSSGIQHDASVSGAYEGGPLVNSNGEVIGLATTWYTPLGFRSPEVPYAPPIRSACDQVLTCPDDDGGSPGERR